MIGSEIEDFELEYENEMSLPELEVSNNDLMRRLENQISIFEQYIVVAKL